MASTRNLAILRKELRRVNAEERVRRNHHIRIGGTFYEPGGRKGTVISASRDGVYRVRWSDGTFGTVEDTEHSAYPTEGSRAWAIALGIDPDDSYTWGEWGSYQDAIAAQEARSRRNPQLRKYDSVSVNGQRGGPMGVYLGPGSPGRVLVWTGTRLEDLPASKVVPHIVADSPTYHRLMDSLPAAPYSRRK